MRLYRGSRETRYPSWGWSHLSSTAWLFAHSGNSHHATVFTVEIDGGYFGGYVKPANCRENRVDRRLTKYQNGKRQVVVMMRTAGPRRARPGHGRAYLGWLVWVLAAASNHGLA